MLGADSALLQVCSKNLASCPKAPLVWQCMILWYPKALPPLQPTGMETLTPYGSSPRQGGDGERNASPFHPSGVGNSETKLSKNL